MFPSHNNEVIDFTIALLLGMTVSVFDLLKIPLNFTTRRVQPEDQSWGSLSVNDTTGDEYWNGMIGMLVAEQADISTAGLTITQERSKVRKTITLHLHSMIT